MIRDNIGFEISSILLIIDYIRILFIMKDINRICLICLIYVYVRIIICSRLISSF